ncbi:hypothetical protein [Bythopirellula polymerisocia]|uniref:Uncharacterized protein n=1 Tax=Bythopirellula polymerisocia TaxID=2528003 RepID=A0A5C6D223_9BACT|nr:hypothetical protein [Bythopirellula polymerisocia]TWU30175.1 hypothetical protein Pla144_09610 [Bythopirellula polymerisocia]
MRLPCLRALLFPVFVLLGEPLPLLLPTASADTFEWTNATGGKFGLASNWSNPAPLVFGPPGVGDNAEFNLADSYDVTFTQNEASDELFVTDGFVRFLSDSTSSHVY